MKSPSSTDRQRTKAANRRLHNRETIHKWLIGQKVCPNVSANQGNKKAADFSAAVFTWSGQRDSNPRPSPWQGDALPAEPCPHVKLSNLEATPGFEPGVKALQASALPLGHVAILASCLIKSWLGVPTSSSKTMERTTGFEPATLTLAR